MAKRLRACSIHHHQGGMKMKSKREYYLPYLERLIDYHKAWVQFLGEHDPEILGYLCASMGRPYTEYYGDTDEDPVREIRMPMSNN
jgi:hypothetical protein